MECRTLFAENKGFSRKDFLKIIQVCGFRCDYFESTGFASAHLFASGQFGAAFSGEDTSDVAAMSFASNQAHDDC